jgi:D-glycero-beta-D-manno-heptose 1-phosphate adenylyltransferase
MIVTREQLKELRADWRTAGHTVVFTNGCFDLLHIGHVKYLEEARQLGDLLVLGLNSDASVRRLKGEKRPLVGQDERALVMNALRPVDYVVIFEETTAESIISELQPEIYVKGGDYAPGANPGDGKPLPEAPAVRAYGGEIRLIQFLPGHSTTELIHKILDTYQV